MGDVNGIPVAHHGVVATQPGAAAIGKSPKAGLLENRAMRIRRAGIVTAVLCGVLLAGMPSFLQGSVFKKVSLREMRDSSEAIVHARVTSVRSAWNDTRSMIYTYVDLEVYRALRGRTDRRIVLREPGGVVDGFRVEALGAPAFEVGEDVVVFLSRWQDGTLMVTGYSQGKSRVEPDKAKNLVLHGGITDGFPLSDVTRQIDQASR